MNTVLVDSNVLIDIASQDPQWASWSTAALAGAASEASLAINAVIYAECSTSYERIEEVEEAIPAALFRREPLPYQAAFLAAKVFLQYRRRGGLRTAPLPDFFIGAHAVVAGFRLLTRDPKRYRTYFPTVELIAP